MRCLNVLFFNASEAGRQMPLSKIAEKKTGLCQYTEIHKIPVGGGEITHRDFIVRNTHHRSSVQMMSISYWQVAAC